MLQESGAVSSNSVNVDLAVNGKIYVIDLTENTEKETGTHIIIFCKNLA